MKKWFSMMAKTDVELFRRILTDSRHIKSDTWIVNQDAINDRLRVGHQITLDSEEGQAVFYFSPEGKFLTFQLRIKEAQDTH